MFSRRQKHVMLKFFSMFSVVRGYNILVIVIAQYLASIYILAHDKPLREVVLDINLFMLVLASASTIAAGYIINNFYDSERDLINRPQRTLFERLVSKRFIFRFYFGTNALVFALALLISWRALVFYLVYAAGLWYYSHKIKKATFLGNFAAALLSVAPFFAIFVYYHYFSWPIFFYVSFILFLILTIFFFFVRKKFQFLEED